MCKKVIWRNWNKQKVIFSKITVFVNFHVILVLVVSGLTWRACSFPTRMTPFFVLHLLKLGSKKSLRFLTKIDIFDTNWDFWPKSQFLTKIDIFELNCDFWPKLWFLTIIEIFDRNWDLWSKFRFLTKISIFDQIAISIFELNWLKLIELIEISILDRNFGLTNSSYFIKRFQLFMLRWSDMVSVLFLKI